LIRTIKKYIRWAQSRITPSSVKAILDFYAAQPIDGVPDLALSTAGYRILKKGIPVQEDIISFQKEVKALQEQQVKWPLVSCLLVTKDRFELASKAVDCYVQQNYPNSELIVIDDGADDRLEELVQSINDPTIRFFRLPDEGTKLGVLRNLSRSHAKGEYLAQWDDDDLSHADRLMFQMTLILKYKLDGCTLQRERLWYPDQAFKAWSNRRIWEGSMIAAVQKLPAYHETRRAEETDAVNTIAMKGTVALLDFPQLYTYCFHGSNTFDEAHFIHTKAQASKIFDNKTSDPKKGKY